MTRLMMALWQGPKPPGSQPGRSRVPTAEGVDFMAKAKKNRTDLAAERYSIPIDWAHAADALVNELFDGLEPQDKLSLLWMGMGMAAVRKNDRQHNQDGVA